MNHLKMYSRRTGCLILLMWLYPLAAQDLSRRAAGWELHGFTQLSRTQVEWSIPDAYMRGSYTWGYGGEIGYRHALSDHWSLRGALQLSRWRVRMYLEAPHDDARLAAIASTIDGIALPDRVLGDHWVDVTSLQIPLGISYRSRLGGSSVWQTSVGIVQRYVVIPSATDPNQVTGRFWLNDNDFVPLYDTRFDVQRHHTGLWAEVGIEQELPFSRHSDALALSLRVEGSPMQLVWGSHTYFPGEAYSSVLSYHFRGGMLSLRLGYLFGRQLDTR